MGDERSRPNWVAQKKYEAIDYWDQEAKQRIKEGKHVRAFGNWAMMQLAKLHAESPAGLALDVASLGTGGLLVKGVQGTARMVKGAKAIQSAKTLVEIDRTLKPVRAAAGITRPLVTTKHKVLEGIGKAAATVEDVAPKFIQPVAVAGQKTLTPRRALKTVSKAVMGAKTESKLGGGGAGGSTVAPLTTKPMRSVLEVGPNTPLDPKVHWVFPAEVVTRSRPQKPPVAPKPAIVAPPKPMRSVATVGPNTPLDPKVHWVFPAEHVTRSRPTKPAITPSPGLSSLSVKPMRSVLEVGPKTPLDPKYHWVFPAERITRSGVPPVPTGRRDPYPSEVSRMGTIGERQTWLRSYYRANPQAADIARKDARTIIDWAHKTIR